MSGPAAARETAPRALTEAERRDWLRLARSEGVGPITFRALIDRFGSAAAALAALPELARRGGRARLPRIPSADEAEAEIAAVARGGARLIACSEPDYPAALAAIEDAPPLLTLAGDARLLHRPVLAIVGARNASAAGQQIAAMLAAELGRHGVVIASGLARGIDSAAHRGALATGTCAVLAGGLDVVYPPENAALQAEIAARGALLSEMPWGTRPQARHFPRRNRIVSGLSRGVIVVEAALRSGSLITARFALEQGREVFAVPGSPLDARCRGSNDLLRQGAILTESAADALAALTDMLAEPRPARPPKPAAEPPAMADTAKSEAQGAGAPEIAAARRSIAALLGPTPVEIDTLVRQSGQPPAAVLTVLLELELAGRLTRSAGQRVALL